MGSFSNTNYERHGGAVCATDHSNIAWEGATYFFHNTAGYLGGAISVFHGSNVSWRGEIPLDRNVSGLYSGGVSLVYVSILSWSGKTRFCDDMAGVDGGAMVAYDHSDVFGSGDTTYARDGALDNAETFWCSVIAPYHVAGKQFLLVIQLKTIMEVRSLYMTALKSFGTEKHNSTITGPAVLEVPLLFSATPRSSVAGIRHIIEIMRFLVQEAFWCSITAPYHGAGKQPAFLIRAKTIVEVRSLYMTALKPFGVGKPNSLKPGQALVEVLWLFTTTLAFSLAGIRYLP